jgi:hypothetical protein
MMAMLVIANPVTRFIIRHPHHIVAGHVRGASGKEQQRAVHLSFRKAAGWSWAE